MNVIILLWLLLLLLFFLLFISADFENDFLRKKQCKYIDKNLTFRRCQPAIIQCAEFWMYWAYIISN